MKEVIHNYYNLKESEISDVIKRVKVLILNTKGEILLAFSDNVYHLPGGHVEDGESLDEALKREILEETGIVLDENTFKPFYKMVKICKDYPKEGINNSYEYYYYKIVTDKKPKLELTKYTDSEKEGNFELKYIKFNELENVLKERIKINSKNEVIVREMLEVLDIYNSINK